jgi:hypothetical protein
MLKRVMTFLGWVLSSALFVTGAFALFQEEPSIALGIIFILWGVLCLPPLYELTQRLETYGWTWNALARFCLALLIPAFMAPWISPKDLSFYQRIRSPFVSAKDVAPASPAPTPSATASTGQEKTASPSPSATPLTVTGSPLPIVKAAALKKGQTYIVAEQTSLMASNDGNDIVADIQQMRLIPKGGVFKVLETVDKKDKRWYQVAAFDQQKKPVGNGWINSTTLAEEVAASSPILIPSTTPSGSPSPAIPSEIAAIIAQAKQAQGQSPNASASPTATSLDAPMVKASSSPKPNTAPSTKTSASPTPTSTAKAAAAKQLTSPSQVLGKSQPAHRVSMEAMANGSRVIIETEDPAISRDQCLSLVKTYLSKAGGKGQIVVYKPNPKPPWNGRVLAFCFNDLDDKGTVMNDFYGW